MDDAQALFDSIIDQSGLLRPERAVCALLAAQLGPMRALRCFDAVGSRIRGRRLYHAKQERLRRGERCGGRWPFGHHPYKPAETAALERLLHLADKGIHPQKIAAALNRESVPTRHGGLWREAVIRRIISRERERCCA